MTIYVVEDDTDIRELLLYTLETAGYTTKGFSNGRAFFQSLTPPFPQLILLDIMLPGQDGISILKQLRETSATKSIPVILLTAKSSEIDKVVGLDTGADDYITKPFGTMELLSRINALLRRTVSEEPERLSSGRVVLDLSSYNAHVDGHPLSLTLKEFELLAYFLKHKNQVFTRNILLEQVWGYDFQGETRTVDVHVASLRQKLGEEGVSLQTIRGIGYRWEESL